MTQTTQQKKRWSAKQKREVVLKYLKGSSMESLSREFKIASSDIHAWKEKFLHGGNEYLKERPDSAETKELSEAQRTIGKLTMEIELLKKKNIQLR